MKLFFRSPFPELRGSGLVAYIWPMAGGGFKIGGYDRSTGKFDEKLVLSKFFASHKEAVRAWNDGFTVVKSGENLAQLFITGGQATDVAAGRPPLK